MTTSSSKNRPRLIALLSLWLLSVGLIAPVPTAHAAPTGCTTWSGYPYTDGVYVWSTGYISCYPYGAVGVGERIQEKVAGIWVTRADYAYTWSSGSTELSKYRSYNCNGHGTDWWRGYAWGQNSNAQTATAAGPQDDLTC